MDKNSTVIWIIIAFFIGIIAFVIIKHVVNVQENYIIWDSPYGDYKVEIIKTGNLTFYSSGVVVGDTLYTFPLRYSPVDVQDILSVPGVQKILASKKMIYTTRDLELGNLTGQMSSIAALEFGKILGNADYGLYKIPVKAAFTESTNKSSAMVIPEITCSNATKSMGVIYMKLGENNQIYLEEQCVIVQGVDAEGLVMTSDKLAYLLLGAF